MRNTSLQVHPRKKDNRPFSKYIDDEKMSLQEEVEKPLREMKFRSDVIDSDSTRLHPYTLRFCQRLVILSLQAIDDWDEWAKALTTGSRKTMHMGMARSAKGLIKVIRNYFIAIN